MSDSKKPSVPNPCSVCGVPIFGSFIGTGDGSMRDGGSFAHPECYWRRRAGDRKRELRRLNKTVERYSRMWQTQTELAGLLRHERNILQFKSGAGDLIEKFRTEREAAERKLAEAQDRVHELENEITERSYNVWAPLQVRIATLETALRNIMEHQQTVAPSAYLLSTVWNIASAALNASNEKARAALANHEEEV